MTQRPAEVATTGTMIGSLVAYIAGVKDPQTLAYVIAGVGMVPAVVTTLVANGGIRGTLRRLWRGK